MHSRHFYTAANRRSVKKRRLEIRVRQRQLDSSQSKLQDKQYEPEHLRDVVEGQYMRMNEAHDRIRDEFLGKTDKFD